MDSVMVGAKGSSQRARLKKFTVQTVQAERGAS
jgi:hypothetical protein